MKAFILSIKILFYKITKSPLAILMITNGKLSIVKGATKRAFITNCATIIADNGIKYGVIYIVRDHNNNDLLKISCEIPDEMLQQLRNTWHYS